MPCLTMLLLPEILSVSPVPMPPPPPGSSKAERDLYSLPNATTSANFAVRWGSSGSVSPADIDRVVGALELSWSEEIEALSMPAPYGTDDWLFNVYIGDSGDGAPSASGVYGYYTVDGDGWPMIVLSLDALAVSAETLTTIPHEFFHALQDAAGTYAYTGDSAWYWEATATWMESVVYPDDLSYAVFLFGFAYLPHYPLTFFDYYDTGAFQELYQYGAFIFPRYIAEQVASPQTIIDTWTDPRGHDEPLGALSERIDLEETIGHFAAHNAIWDYEDGATYADYLDYYADFPEYGDNDYRIAVTIESGGTDGWALPPAETLPGRYGTNVLDVPTVGLETPWVSLAGDAIGSEGSAASWWLTVIETDGPVYHHLMVTEAVSSFQLSLGTGPVKIVVTAMADDAVEGETFEYRYALGDEPELTLDEVDTGDTGDGESEGCGCRGGSAGVLWLLPLYGSLRSRRRRTTTPSPSSNRSS
ncbi:MAG: hypothetical protein ACI8RZ_007418 [Myxococcota bacterium]|jgi:hypothetical protein